MECTVQHELHALFSLSIKGRNVAWHVPGTLQRKSYFLFSMCMQHAMKMLTSWAQYHIMKLTHKLCVTYVRFNFILLMCHGLSQHSSANTLYTVSLTAFEWISTFSNGKGSRQEREEVHAYGVALEYIHDHLHWLHHKLKGVLYTWENNKSRERHVFSLYFEDSLGVM